MSKETKKKRNKRVFTKKNYMSGDGMLTTVWGPSMWHYLHTMSFNYPVKPSDDDKKHYKTNPDGSRKIIKFDGQSTLWEEITISHQVRGSWKRINLFDGMLSNGVYDLLVGSDGLLYIATFFTINIHQY